MKIHLLSDLHLEFADCRYPKVEADVVILAGDIHTKESGLRWAIDNIASCPVIYVLGNHEFYGKAYPKHIRSMKELAKGGNVSVLENDVI